MNIGVFKSTSFQGDGNPYVSGFDTATVIL